MVREGVMKKKHELHLKTEEESRKRWHFEEAVFFFFLNSSFSIT